MTTDCPKARAEVAVLRRDVEYLKRRVVALQIKMIDYERNKNISDHDRLRHGTTDGGSDVLRVQRSEG